MCSEQEDLNPPVLLNLSLEVPSFVHGEGLDGLTAWALPQGLRAVDPLALMATWSKSRAGNDFTSHCSPHCARRSFHPPGFSPLKLT